MRLGSSAEASNLPVDLGSLPRGHPQWWGSNERPLRAPESLLKWLVQNISPESVSRSGDTGEVLRKRQLLSRRDPITVAEAYSLIERGRTGQHWFKLEGESYPDACFQTPKIMLVVEGKRTERECTTKTKWMGRRSQLVRHMDAALEIAGTRRVFGLLIVEPTETSDQRPTKFWLDQMEQQRSDEMLASSLPHRTAAERTLLKNGILGVTTWQRACRQLGVPWPLGLDQSRPSGPP